LVENMRSAVSKVSFVYRCLELLSPVALLVNLRVRFALLTAPSLLRRCRNIYTPYLYGLAPRSGHPGNKVTFMGNFRSDSLTVR